MDNYGTSIKKTVCPDPVWKALKRGLPRHHRRERVTIYVSMYVYVYICIYVCMIICIYVSMYLGIYVSCIYVSMYLCKFVLCGLGAKGGCPNPSSTCRPRERSVPLSPWSANGGVKTPLLTPRLSKDTRLAPDDVHQSESWIYHVM